MIDFELLVDEIRIKARAAILDGRNLELEPSQFSDCMEYLIDRLRQAEKDAARYIFLRDEATDYHAGVIHGAREEDRDDLVDIFMEQLNEKVKQIERAK